MGGPRGETPRRQQGQGGIAKGRAAPQHHQAAHARAQGPQLRPAVAQKTSAGPEEDGRGQQHLQEPLAAPAQPGIQPVAQGHPEHGPHGQDQQRQGKGQPQPQVASEAIVRDARGRLCLQAGLVARPPHRRRDGVRCQHGRQIAHLGLLRGQVDRRLDDPRQATQDPLDPGTAIGAGHAADPQSQVRLLGDIARIPDDAQQFRDARLVVVDDRGLGGQIHHRLGHARQALQHPLHPTAAVGAGHAAHAEADFSGHGGAPGRGPTPPAPPGGQQWGWRSRAGNHVGTGGVGRVVQATRA